MTSRESTSDSKKPLPFHRRWARPLSTAAVVLLAIWVVLLMTREGTLNHRTEMDVPSEYGAAPASSPPPVADLREELRTAQPARTEPMAEEKVKPKSAPPSSPVESKLSKAAPARVRKESEAPAVGRATEADRSRLARKEQVQKESVPAGVPAMSTRGADVTGVVVNGSPGSYSFNVTVKSPDTGCKQYADWWEVLSEDGRLLYRRVLFHSHVGEQPFTRSGGPVPIQPDALVWVRAHMNTSGYGGAALKGSVKAGFKPAALDASFAAAVEKQSPLPDGCAF